MAIATYADLKTAVASWLHRSDLTTQIADFVALCEANIRRDLRCRAMEQSATGTLLATTLAIPTGFLEVRRVMLANIVQDYVEPGLWNEMREETNDRYTVLGTNFVFQSSTAAYQIDYYKQFDSLSASGDTNWLLTNHPDVYLFGTLAEAAMYTDDPERMAKWRSRYMDSIDRVRNLERNSIGPLTVRPYTRNTP